MKILKRLLFLIVLVMLLSKAYLPGFTDKIIADGMRHVYAKEDRIQYSYDSTGRLLTAKYPDGTQITYQYDNAGNIKASLLDEEKAENERTEEEKTETEVTEGEKTETGAMKHDQRRLHGTGFMRINRMLLQGKSGDGYVYTSFQKKRPVIKSLKTEKQKKKTYLKIQIKKIKLEKSCSESGYQIKYSTKEDFKNAKTVTVPKKKKSSVTGKKWKVKKGKVYYVKVRAYIKNGMGQYLYSKYSKTVKIQTNRQ